VSNKFRNCLYNAYSAKNIVQIQLFVKHFYYGVWYVVRNLFCTVHNRYRAALYAALA